MLRTAVHHNMEGPGEGANYFKEQWMHTALERDLLAFGIEIERSSDEWAREWQEELNVVKVRPPPQGRGIPQGNLNSGAPGRCWNLPSTCLALFWLLGYVSCRSRLKCLWGCSCSLLTGCNSTVLVF